MKKKQTPKKTATKKAKSTATKKTASKKPAKKVAVKKATKKTAPKSKPVKPAKKKAPTKKAATKKASAKTKKAATKSEQTPAQARILINRRNRTQTPAFVRVRTRKNTPIVFSLEDVQEIIQKRKTETKTPKPSAAATKKAVSKASDPKETKSSTKKRVLGAASITDILGFNPKKKQNWQSMDESRVPKKHLKSYKDLIKLRTQVQQGLDYHAKETLNRSSKDDSGNLSGYSQHMADSGTDTFDRDFALSLVSSEQDLIYEIDEAIQRIFDGSYGICEITGKAIPRLRLAAVPFTRYSLEGQREQERIHNRKAERGGIFGELASEDAASFSDEDSED